MQDCRDSGKPFVLFLRSFSAEYTDKRIEKEVFGTISINTMSLQKSLDVALAPMGIPAVRLHGGSDGFMSSSKGDASILSTHAQNWQPIAAELISAAGAIVFLVSETTPGVLEEIDRIRSMGLQDRCFVVLPVHKISGAGDIAAIRGQMTDFPQIYELRTEKEEGRPAYPPEMLKALVARVQEARCDATFEAALVARFTYLEPGFVESGDYADTQAAIWETLRQLRVLFEGTYWAALKRLDLPLGTFTFPTAWTAAHRAYGLAVATEDFNAMHEALNYIGLLNLRRNADLALLPGMLAHTMMELGQQIHGGRLPDTEGAQFKEPCLLTFTRKTENAVALLKQALASDNPDLANHLYHVAVIMGLGAAENGDPEARRMLGGICGHWASYQFQVHIKEWAVINARLATALFRELFEEHGEAHTSDLAISLNNLGTFYLNLGDHRGAVAPYTEAVELRRGPAEGSDKETVNLYNSLASLGYLRVEMGEHDAALPLYEEALEICAAHTARNPSTVSDLVRLQGWMCQALAGMDGRSQAATACLEKAKTNLDKVNAVIPEMSVPLSNLIENAARACRGTPPPE